MPQKGDKRKKKNYLFFYAILIFIQALITNLRDQGAKILLLLLLLIFVYYFYFFFNQKLQI